MPSSDGWSPEAAPGRAPQPATGRGRGRGGRCSRTRKPGRSPASPAVAVPAPRPAPFAPDGPPAPQRAATWAPGPVWSRSTGGGVSISRVSVDVRRGDGGSGARTPPPPASTLTTPLLSADQSAAASEADVEAGRPAAAPPQKSAAAAASLVFNFILLAAKLAAFFLSGSKAVLASTVDSVVDIASQAVLAAAEARATTRDPRFPVGRARYTAVGVTTAAGIMIASTLAVVWQAGADLVAGFVFKDPPKLILDPPLYIILSLAIAIKAGLWAWCARASRAAAPGAADTLAALAEDHRTDVFANAAALTAGFAARYHWSADPVTALALSAWILSVWARVFRKQVDKIVGRIPDAVTISALERVCADHAPAATMEVDVLRAWHWGERVHVEVEVVMPPDTTVRESHDLALALQHKLEAVPEVERATVHVDYERRAEPEHAVDRALSGLLPLDAASPNVPTRGASEGRG